MLFFVETGDIKYKHNTKKAHMMQHLICIL